MTLTYAQRLALDHRERTNGYEDDPSPAEIFEAQDEEFRHWDQYHFAPAITWSGPLRANGGEPSCQKYPGGSPPPTFDLHARGPKATGTDVRERGATASSDDDGGAPTTCPVDSESSTAPPTSNPGSGEGASSDPLEGVLPAPSWQHWMWAA